MPKLRGLAALSLAWLCLLQAGLPARAADDALTRKVLAELGSFEDWVSAHGVRAFVGEIGWPDDYAGEAQRWNELADTWLGRADSSGLSAGIWATGVWWSDYRLAPYEDLQPPEGVDTPNTQAPVVEAHPSTASYMRALVTAAGVFCEPEPLDRVIRRFSNRRPGRYGHCRVYDPQETFDYLAARGVDTVKIEFRWESVQRRLGGPLDDAELERLTAAVQRARAAGLDVILDMHNFGAYWLHDPGRDAGVRRPIGSSQVPIRYFADVWRRLSRAFGDRPGVYYALMCEPVAMRGSGDRSAAEVWERASQAALNAVRSTGDDKLVLVSGYQWASLVDWTSNHPGPWIDDPADNFMYEAHHYWDRDHSGGYTYTYADEVAHAESLGY